MALGTAITVSALAALSVQAKLLAMHLFSTSQNIAGALAADHRRHAECGNVDDTRHVGALLAPARPHGREFRIICVRAAISRDRDDPAERWRWFRDAAF